MDVAETRGGSRHATPMLVPVRDTSPFDVPRCFRRLVRAALGVAGWLSALLLLVLLWRRLTQTFEPPGLTELLMLSLLAQATSVVWRAAAWMSGGNAACFAWPGFIHAIMGVAVTLPGASVGGLVILWMGLAVHELLAWSWYHRAKRGGTEGPTDAGSHRASSGRFGDGVTTGAETHAPRRDDVGHLESLLGTVPRDLDAMQWEEHPHVRQHVVRLLDDGYDTLVGELRCHFASRERTRSEHLAFCPPFDGPPEVFVESLDGPAVRIKTALAAEYGARFDLRLEAEHANEVDVMLRVVARRKMPSANGVASSDNPGAEDGSSTLS